MNHEAPRRRYFTPAEANALLPVVVAQLLAARGLVERSQDAMARARADAPGAPRARLMTEARRLRQEATEILADIEDLGVEIKGLREGLLDFPALRNNREVLLCWREGEEGIAWWHPRHTGIAGREPIDDDDLGCWEWLN